MHSLVKVLDFGLAKLVQSSAGDGQQSDGAQTVGASDAGLIGEFQLARAIQKTATRSRTPPIGTSSTPRPGSPL